MRDPLTSTEIRRRARRSMAATDMLSALNDMDGLVVLARSIRQVTDWTDQDLAIVLYELVTAACAQKPMPKRRTHV